MYERRPGAAAAALPREYRRHEPERTLLYEVVQTNLLTFLAEAQMHDGAGVPWFVERELRRYLACGVLAHGFARVRCQACGHDLVVGFSCKGRGLCPSCTARRTHDTAAHLVDRVIPRIPMRQWVLAFPHRVRFVLARRPRLLSAVLSFFVRALFALQRRRARARGLPVTRAGSSGAVTFVQRFGSALQLTPHFHTLVPDGVFVEESSGLGDRLRFVALEPPDGTEVEEVLRRVVAGVDKLVSVHGFSGKLGEPHADAPPDLLSDELASAMAMPPCRPEGVAPLALPGLAARTARQEGFSLHADVAVHENDRQGLERLCRYGLRPALSLARLSRAEDGRLRYRMKRTFSDGTCELVLTPSELLRRLCALIPPPRVHITRYHGVFAPNARQRRRVTGQARSRRSPPRDEAPAGSTGPPVLSGAPASPDAVPVEAEAACRPGAPPDSPQRLRYLPWAELLRRVHEVDVIRCSRCPGRRRVIAFITDAEVVTAILVHLGLPARPPPLAPARAPPEAQLPFAGWPDTDFIDPPVGEPA